ncbi:MAG: ribonuclease PH, partial [Geothrix sp.]
VETGEGRRGMVLDLEYEEDHLAAVDCNLVAARPTLGGALELVEFQGTGEGRAFSRAEATGLLDLGLAGCAALMDAQGAALG